MSPSAAPLSSEIMIHKRGQRSGGDGAGTWEVLIERWRTHLIVQLDSKQARSIDKLAHSMQLQRIRSNVRATAAPRTVFPGPLAILALLCRDGVAFGGQMAHPLPKCDVFRNGNRHANIIVLWLRARGSGPPEGAQRGGRWRVVSCQCDGHPAASLCEARKKL